MDLYDDLPPENAADPGGAAPEAPAGARGSKAGETVAQSARGMAAAIAAGLVAPPTKRRKPDVKATTFIPTALRRSMKRNAGAARSPAPQAGVGQPVLDAAAGAAGAAAAAPRGPRLRRSDAAGKAEGGPPEDEPAEDGSPAREGPAEEGSPRVPARTAERAGVAGATEASRGAGSAGDVGPGRGAPSLWNVEDAYDPSEPNDYVKWCEERVLRRERIKTQRRLAVQMQEQEAQRQQLERSRRHLLRDRASGDGEGDAAMETSKRRGVSNLPAWMAKG